MEILRANEIPCMTLFQNSVYLLQQICILNYNELKMFNNFFLI